jgi:drug/metabolite transporter (DMT)-like permease
MFVWGSPTAKPVHVVKHPLSHWRAPFLQSSSPTARNVEQDVSNDLFSISLSVIVYVLCSSCMPIVNKAAMKVLPRVYAVTAMQTASAAVLLLMIRHANFVDFPNPTPAKVWSWTGVLVAWTVPIVLNMKAIQLLSVETVMMFRSLSIVIVAFGDFMILKTKITTRSIVSCLIISLGGLVYASNDLNFHLEGYIIGTLYSLSMVVNSLYIKYCFNKHQEMNSWEKGFLNNLLSTPAVVALSFFYENFRTLSVDMKTLSLGGIISLALSCLMGFGISMSGTKCRDVLSATSFDVLGSCTKYLTLALSTMILRAQNSVLSIVGICIALSGTVLYSPAGDMLCRSIGPKQSLRDVGDGTTKRK